LASWIFYTSTKHSILDKQKEILKYESQHIKSKLRSLHRSDKKRLLYPKNSDIKSAIYDLDKNYIFGTFNAPLDEPMSQDKIYLISQLEPYYLGAAYLKVYKKIDCQPIKDLQRDILIFMFIGGLFFTVLGYYLGKLFIAPMRESIKQINHFIQDATHELNTPISTILTNIEMIEALNKHKENKTELKRIEIASKTLSRIYDDLTYLNLNHQYHREIESINMNELLNERILYFTALAEAKNITIKVDTKPNTKLQIDKNDALRLIDNLISNAIKYNKIDGSINIILTDKHFSIQDSGVGIKDKDLSTITKRFKRANKSEGGFGIGLDIVNQVVNSYDFTLKIESKLNFGTKVTIKWSK
jgi:two-component system OmpR family sensor kinase